MRFTAGTDPLGSTLKSMVIAFAAALVACSDSGTGPDRGEPEPNRVRLQSDANDYIGQGRTYEYTSATAALTITATGGRLSVHVEGDESWFGEFQMPATATRIAVGTYSNLERYPFHDPAEGGLSWYGEGRGCNMLTGSFTVDSVGYVGDTLTGIDLRFEQHCEGGTAALRGTIHWRRNNATAAPGPQAIPTSLWRPPAGSVPASGDYVFLQSDPGDFIGQGLTRTYTEANSTITINASGGLLSVGVGGTESWSGEFRVMSSLSRIERGYYPDLQRYPFHNPVRGGLSWSGEGRGCNTLLGWFAVDRVTYSGNTLMGFDLRFEQRCEGGTAALRGAIRWDR